MAGWENLLQVLLGGVKGGADQVVSSANLEQKAALTSQENQAKKNQDLLNMFLLVAAKDRAKDGNINLSGITSTPGVNSGKVDALPLVLKSLNSSRGTATKKPSWNSMIPTKNQSGQLTIDPDAIAAERARRGLQ